MTIPAIFFGGAGGECISLEDKIIETLLKHVMLNLLVALHVLLAAKSFSANIAVVQGRCVAPLRDFSYLDFVILEDKKSYLMNEKVVRF